MSPSEISGLSAPDPSGPVSRSAAELRNAIATLLSRNKRREAYELLQHAVVQHPNDPYLLSSFGYLSAVLEGRYRNGIDACLSAIKLFNRKSLIDAGEDDESQLGALYLNLGRAYLSAARKKDAIDAFHAGLKADKQSRALQSEIKKMGIRKMIPVPFLARTNPINEIIGRLLRKKSTQQNEP